MIFYINIFIIIILLILFYMVIITILVTVTIISTFTIIISVIFVIIFNTRVPIYLSSKQSLAMFFPVYPYKYNGSDSRRQEPYYALQKLYVNINFVLPLGQLPVCWPCEGQLAWSILPIVDYFPDSCESGPQTADNRRKKL